MEAVNAHLTDSTALNMPVPTILIPAKETNKIQLQTKSSHSRQFFVMFLVKNTSNWFRPQIDHCIYTYSRNCCCP